MLLSKISLLASVLLLITGSLPAKDVKNYGDLEVSQLISIYDGDTFKVNIAELHPLIGDNISVRVAGIDTPELKSKDPEEKFKAYQAKALAEKVLRNSQSIVLHNVRRDKYFRILADVFVDGVNLAEVMLNSGLAKPYDGKTKPSWP